MGHVNRPADSWADTSGAPPTALLCGNEAQAPGPAPPPLHAPTWSISVLFNNFRIKSPFSAVGWVTMGRGWKPHLGPQIATEPSWVASRNPGLVTVQTWLQGPGLARRHQLSEGQQLRAGAAQQVMALHRLWLLLHRAVAAFPPPGPQFQQLVGKLGTAHSKHTLCYAEH